VSTRCAPCLARAIAACRPMPLVAPVITKIGTDGDKGALL
jgi:hypothetical protein